MSHDLQSAPPGQAPLRHTTSGSDSGPESRAQMARAWRNVIVLVLAQALLGSQMSMIFIVGGLAGMQLAPNPCLATLPISMIVLGSVLTARPLSGLMQRRGRRLGFSLATMAGALGAALAALALWHGSFALFMAASVLTGVYMSAQGFYRFAATDQAPEAFQAKAISWVMAGGLVSAVLGPQLVKLTAQAMVVPFLATYLAVIVLNLLGPLLFACLAEAPKTAPQSADQTAAAPVTREAPPTQSAPRSLRALLRTPQILVAMICATVAYALMNLVMTSTPLAVVGCGFTQNHAADIVGAHVLAMFLPSFFTGHLIARLGRETVVAIGLVILAGAGMVAISGVELGNFFLALVLLGLGWNFAFIGATAMLTAAQRPSERGTLQGFNDFVVFGGVFLASLSSGGLMNCAGGSAEAGWQAVNLAMLPFLVLAGGALVWLVLRPRDRA